MKQKLAIVLLTLSAGLSAWIFWGSDIKLEQLLMSREWQSRLETYISQDLKEQMTTQIGTLNRVTVHSNVKYLPNGTYLRVSTIDLYEKDNNAFARMNISESGEWDISDNYLLVNPKEFKDLNTSKIDMFTQQQQNIIKEFFVIDAEQSRRIDVVNNKSILLTSLSHGSRLIYSN